MKYLFEYMKGLESSVLMGSYIPNKGSRLAPWQKYFKCVRGANKTWLPAQRRFLVSIEKEVGHNFWVRVPDNFIANMKFSEFQAYCQSIVKRAIEEMQTREGSYVTRDGVRVRRERPTRYTIPVFSGNLVIERDLDEMRGCAGGTFLANLLGVSRQTVSRLTQISRKKFYEYSYFDQIRLSKEVSKDLAEEVNRNSKLLPYWVRGRAICRKHGTYYVFNTPFNVPMELVRRKAKSYAISPVLGG